MNGKPLQPVAHSIPGAIISGWLGVWHVSFTFFFSLPIYLTMCLLFLSLPFPFSSDRTVCLSGRFITYPSSVLPRTAEYRTRG